MRKVRVDIPYTELSMTVKPDSKIEKSILTPFGVIDVVVEETFDDVSNRSYFDVYINGDVEKWVYDEKIHEEFKKSLIDFLKHLVIEDILCLVPGHKNLRFIIRFRQSEVKIETLVR